MVWSSTKIKVGWGLFCLILGGGCGLIAMSQQGFVFSNFTPAIPILLLGLLSLFPSKSQAKAGITKDSLIIEFGIKDIISERGIIAEDKIINGNLEFELLATDGGYTNKTIRNMIKKHWQTVQGKSIVIRVETPNWCTVFNNFGLYVETGREFTKHEF